MPTEPPVVLAGLGYAEYPDSEPVFPIAFAPVELLLNLRVPEARLDEGGSVE
jgi:hypothetical protein